ncbi:PREDICTED: uncharacterized mitochondrial protein AtMg00810-like [Prunus mume]|uniref:Uncharacterized mitochondrial protein AtMg00810-like n=1 Tax=Prunus mume TaxID=102107 RepID=A0ABM1LUF8_PRUMU|nr:PREDICTED: uncharacterized mitochondrial protein AtMg00810-like [Prunus mume]
MVKPTNIHVVLHLAVPNGWSIRQLDVNNAFLHDTISDTVYMSQPPGFVDANLPSHFIATLAYRFSIKYLGFLHYFLGVEVVPTTTGLFLSQHYYIRDLLLKAKMDSAKEVSTPLSPYDSLVLNDGSPPTDASRFRQIIGGGLQHLNLTRPDISFAFVRDRVNIGLLKVSHVSTVDQLADALTKPLPRLHFDLLRSKIGVSDGTTILRGLKREPSSKEITSSSTQSSAIFHQSQP